MKLIVSTQVDHGRGKGIRMEIIYQAIGVSIMMLGTILLLAIWYDKEIRR